MLIHITHDANLMAEEGLPLSRLLCVELAAIRSPLT
jgi:hypothetical protein